MASYMIYRMWRLELAEDKMFVMQFGQGFGTDRHVG